MDKNYLNYVVECLQGMETANEVRQYLGKILSQVEKDVRLNDEDAAKLARGMQKLLRKASKNMPYQTVFVFGQYYEKFGNVVTNYNKEKEIINRMIVLSNPVAITVFEYLYKNGAVDASDLFTALKSDKVPESDIERFLWKLKEVELVSISAVTEEVLDVALTAAGYQYYRMYILK